MAPAGVEEEPLTASLIGGLTSCLAWYALLAQLDQDEADERRHCDVYWAHQPRHVERWRERISAWPAAFRANTS